MKLRSFIQNYDALRNFSLEEHTDGQKRQELEYTFYGKLDDFSVLQSDIVERKEIQEQYHLPIESDHIGLRLRRINTTNFVMTVKARREGVKGKEESNQEITEDTFNLLRETAVSGFKKVRYLIPVEGTELTWEIDVFTDAVGQVHPWVKLDLEVPNVDTQLPDLPFAMSEKIVGQGDRKTEKEKALLDRLWNNEWNILNDTPPETGKFDPVEEPVTKDDEEEETSLESHSEDSFIKITLSQDKIDEVLYITHDEEEAKEIRDEYVGIAEKLNGAASSVMSQLYENGPLKDGDLDSKSGRDLLVNLGLAAKIISNGEDGYQALTYKGRTVRDLIVENNRSTQDPELVGT